MANLSDVMAGPPKDTARTRDGRIICSHCEKDADSIHLAPLPTEVEKITACCSDHDDDGYWFPISELGIFLRHLAGKAGFVGAEGVPTHAVVELLWWLPHGMPIHIPAEGRSGREPGGESTAP